MQDDLAPETTLQGEKATFRCGHPKSGSNLKPCGGGKYQCRACSQERDRNRFQNMSREERDAKNAQRKAERARDNPTKAMLRARITALEAKLATARNDALEEAAKVIGRRMDARFEEHGTREWDTNACYYEGSAAETYEALDEEADELMSAIRALATLKEQSDG